MAKGYMQQTVDTILRHRRYSTQWQWARRFSVTTNRGSVMDATTNIVHRSTSVWCDPKLLFLYLLGRRTPLRSSRCVGTLLVEERYSSIQSINQYLARGEMTFERVTAHKFILFFFLWRPVYGACTPECIICGFIRRTQRACLISSPTLEV